MTALSNQSFDGKTIKLVNDITLDADSGSFGSNDVKFKGTIDGNNKTITFSNGKELITKAAGCTIKNLNTAGTMSGNGLISEASPYTEIMTFDNCHNKVEINSTDNCTGSFIGMYNQGSSKVSFTNCTNEGKIEGSRIGGGFIGSISASNSNRVSVTIKNCSNKGDVSGNLQGCGGFVGNVTDFVELNIDRCHNENKVQGQYAGGIIGWVAESCLSVTVTNCYNAGESVQGTSVAGGIIGFISISTTTIRNCYNSAKIIKSSGSAGGIVGGYNGNLSIKFTNCVNYGEFSDAANSGGCFGSDYTSPTYTNCYSYYPEQNYEDYPEKVIYNKSNTGTVQNYKITNDNKPIINDGSDADLILTLNNNIVEGDCEWKFGTDKKQPYLIIN